jgi:hypothetical protein
MKIEPVKHPLPGFLTPKQKLARKLEREATRDKQKNYKEMTGRRRGPSINTEKSNPLVPRDLNRRPEKMPEIARKFRAYPQPTGGELLSNEEEKIFNEKREKQFAKPKYTPSEKHFLKGLEPKKNPKSPPPPPKYLRRAAQRRLIKT